MTALQELAIIFGPVAEATLPGAAEIVVALPRLCRGLLCECALGYAGDGPALVAIARLDAAALPPEVVQRVEFWSSLHGGRVTPLPPGGAARRTAAYLIGLCEEGVTGVTPANLVRALRSMLARHGVKLEALGSVPEPTLAIDLDHDVTGLMFDGPKRALFVSSPFPLPLGDELSATFATGGVVRQASGSVLWHRDAGAAGAGSPSGFLVSLDAVPLDLATILASRLAPGSQRRMSPRHSVHVPVSVATDHVRGIRVVRAASGDAADLVADHVENLSQGGAFVRTSASLAIGSRVRLELHVPGRSLLALDARVVHARPDGIGVLFEPSREEERLLASAIWYLVQHGRQALVVDDDVLSRKMAADAATARDCDPGA